MGISEFHVISKSRITIFPLTYKWLAHQKGAVISAAT